MEQNSIQQSNILCYLRKTSFFSAYSLLKRGFGSLRKFRNKYDLLYIDSGAISAWKKNDLDWLSWETQLKYVEKSKSLNPSAICHLDLTMEPSFLIKNGYTSKQALDQTVYNAKKFLEIDTNKSKKIFAIQGWKTEEYLRCIDIYEDLGIFESNNIIGVGTTCMRKPPSLYRIYKKVIPKIRKINPDQTIHAFGIAKPEWLYNLFNFGINSGDSATSVVAAGMREVDSNKRIKLRVSLPKNGFRGLFILNSWLWYMRLWNKFNNNSEQTQLSTMF